MQLSLLLKYVKRRKNHLKQIKWSLKSDFGILRREVISTLQHSLRNGYH